VMHGYIDSDDVRLLSDKDAFPGVVLSTALVPEEELQEIIASASVGVVFYGDEVANSRLTAFASEKLARYLQAGVPIIAFDMGNYRVLMDRFACGRLITAMEELPIAVDTIFADYERFSANALAAFNEIYSFDANFEKVARFISENFSGRTRTATYSERD
jgi:glycosyltransferase involved in cell wall biosynthesis